MKRIRIIAVGILTIIIIGILLMNVKEKDTEVTKEKTKVGFILNGSCQDKSWGQSHYEGMEKCKEELNLSVLYRENVTADVSCMAVMEELIKEGCEIIICNSFDFGEWELQVADKYPDIYFFHATGVENAHNLTTYFGRIYQMRYLSGIVAGLQTETNQIGYVAAYPISEVNRGINAFTLGVRAVNPDAVVYVEWSNSWTETDKNREAAARLLDNHDIDVLTGHEDSQGMLELADERGVWSIGYNMDNSETYPDTFLTAPIWQWDTFYRSRILECLQGKFQGKHYWEGAESGIVSFAPFTENVKEGIGEIVNQEREKLINGTYDVFYGPIKDQNGVIRIGEGENMSDDAMLNEFDWYVEGVVLDDEE